MDHYPKLTYRPTLTGRAITLFCHNQNDVPVGVSAISSKSYIIKIMPQWECLQYCRHSHWDIILIMPEKGYYMHVIMNKNVIIWDFFYVLASEQRNSPIMVNFTFFINWTPVGYDRPTIKIVQLI